MYNCTMLLSTWRGDEGAGGSVRPPGAPYRLRTYVDAGFLDCGTVNAGRKGD